MKQIITAKSAGFCGGVTRAVSMAEKALAERAGSEIYSVGELIHNADEMNRLRALGLRVTESVEAVPAGAAVIIRAHGMARADFDTLRGKGCDIIDATCPLVSKIHRIAERETERGRELFVLGDAEHPEVRGICGWARNARVFPDAESLQSYAESDNSAAERPVSLVFQTTQTNKNCEICKNLIKKIYTNGKIFDTICEATHIRQSEALHLADICGGVVVVGGKHSANSRHLFELVSERCTRVQFIESPSEFDASLFEAAEVVGLTAGASVPAWILKEVKQKMCDEIITNSAEEEVTAPPAEETAAPAEKPECAAPEAAVEPEAEEQSAAAEPAAQEVAGENAGGAAADGEESFAALLEDSLKTIYNGDTVKGVVAAITPTEISVDLGAKQSGYIPVEEFTDGTNAKIEDLVHVGDTIEASVVHVNDMEGTVKLSKRRLDAAKNWNEIEAAAADGTVVEGLITENNKGGLVANVKGIRVFIPASQSGQPKNADLSEMVKQTVRLKITEVNRGRRRVVGSIRAVLAKERRERTEKIWSELEVGKRYDGVVKSLTSYGAFVDIGGVDGMVHVSELSWKRINRPDEVVSVGDEINVYVIGFDREKRRISLGYKDPDGNPWDKFMATYAVGAVANVRIVKLMTFGAFAEVLPGVDGLIHISQIANRRIGKPDEVLTVGDMVDAKITAIDEEKHKVSLSIRALSEPAPAPRRAERERDRDRDRDYVPERQSKPMVREDALVYTVSETGQAAGIAPDDEPAEDEAE
ncbi:MAG: bifunctional 4-hydroxy-3-methylbut-2-enyl diphosphate reductase/30S ribosomal protein S1 [Oscillospiraceae bacterium]|nr:bifunctional 4-hydroxy-3-methylbut-2-enyl diphosphate reductase/30S ribosomal protein S1 [Oscillospiraceae bacterium]